MAAPLLRRGSRAWSAKCGPLIQIYFTATRSGFVVKNKVATTYSRKEKTGDSPCRKAAEV
jgi:hypothetical protein